MKCRVTLVLVQSFCIDTDSKMSICYCKKHDRAREVKKDK